MAANVQIISLHGPAGGTETQIDGQSIRFKQADNDTFDALNPVPIPAAGTNYSWIKQVRFKAVTSPTNTINNLKFYTDGVNGLGTGIDLLVRTIPAADYQNPATVGATALVADTPSGAAAPVSAFTYNSGAALAIAGSISNPSTGLFGDIVQLQIAVDSTASQGNSANETLTWSFDES